MRLPSRSMKYVLIETYWNVKNKYGLNFDLDYSVLIETYWNVKEGVVV